MLSLADGAIQSLKVTTSIFEKEFPIIIITPLLMHGWQVPTGRNRSRAEYAEIRIPSIKGVIRYWWRALHVDLDVKELALQEAKLFGGTGNVDALRSPLLLSLTASTSSTEKVQLCPHNTQKMAEAPGIPQDTEFRLKMAVLKKDEKLFLFYDSLIKVVLMLGGFGQRSRRGAGAIQLTTVWEDINEYTQGLKQLFVELGVVEKYNWNCSSGKVLALKQHYGANHPCLIGAWLGEAFSDAEAARKRISWAGKIANDPAKKQYLGSTFKGRQASPLIATVKKIGQHYYPIISEVATAKIVTDSNYIKARDNFLQIVGVAL